MNVYNAICNEYICWLWGYLDEVEKTCGSYERKLQEYKIIQLLIGWGG